MNMNFTQPKGSFRYKGLMAAVAVCLVAVGAAAWLGVSKTPSPTDSAKVDSSAASRPQYIYDPDDNNGAMVTPEPSETQSKPQQSTSKPSETVQTVTPTATFFVLPMTGEIIKDFSDTELQYSLTFNDWRLHKAVDIKGVSGSSVNAAGDGTVTAVYDDKQYGLTVEINHGNDIIAIYSGLETVGVSVGDVVAVNMQIGSLGKIPCESVETSHLHFSVKKGDTFIPPLNIMGV